MKYKGLYFLFALLILLPDVVLAKQQQGVVTLRVDLSQYGDKTARLWLPYPLSDDYQIIEKLDVNGSFIQSAVYREPESHSLFLFAQWEKSHPTKILTMTFKVTAKERKSAPLTDTGEPLPVEIKQYLQADGWIPTEGEVAEIAQNLAKDKTTILEKARAVYDWVVENTTRDPNIRGCGTGIVERTLAKRSGKCADLSSVYVALARNIGVPSREVFGLRLGNQDNQDITGGYHCWAEFYLPGTGWVPVDPSDVRKKMLAENLSLSDVAEFREYYFGAVDEYRIVLEKGGRNIRLPFSEAPEPLNYLMYPYAEIGGKALDFFDFEDFKYSVHFHNK